MPREESEFLVALSPLSPPWSTSSLSPPPFLPIPSLRTPADVPVMASHNSSSSNNVVGAHYRVGKKIGEGSFGVIFEGLSSTRSLIRVPRNGVRPTWRAQEQG